MRKLLFILCLAFSLCSVGQNPIATMNHGMYYTESAEAPPEDKIVLLSIDNTMYRSTDGGRTFDAGSSIGAATALRFGDMSKDEQVVFISNTVPTDNSDQDVGHYSTNGGSTWSTFNVSGQWSVFDNYTGTVSQDGTKFSSSGRDIEWYSESPHAGVDGKISHNLNAGGVEYSVTGDTAWITSPDGGTGDIYRSINNSSYSVVCLLTNTSSYLNDISADKSVFVSEVHAASNYHKMNIANLNTNTNVEKTVAASTGNITNAHCSEDGTKIVTRDATNFIVYYSEDSGSTFTGVSFTSGVGNTNGRFKLTKDGRGVYYYNADCELYYASWSNFKDGKWIYLNDVGTGTNFFITTY